MNALKQLHTFGQSFWYDNIRRDMLLSGELERLIKEDGLRGITSNPSIFQKALSSGGDYDASIEQLAGKGKSTTEIFDALSIEDIRRACDVLKPVFVESQGADGFVSLEVSPHLARDAGGTLNEARRLWKGVGKHNAMIKIPATVEGLTAFENALAEGINVNVTLIFSLERYRQVLAAYRRGLERLAKDDAALGVASVASFFISRIDTAVDKIAQEKLQASKSAHEKDVLLEIVGKTAVANAKMAYQIFKKFFGGAWFEPLRKKGARVQRPLWASTSTKNPHYPDTLYVDALIGENTVNTIPPATVDAFRDHGTARQSIEENAAGAAETLEKLKLVQIDLKDVTDRLEEEGVKAFADAYDGLLAGLAAKKRLLEKNHSASR